MRSRDSRSLEWNGPRAAMRMAAALKATLGTAPDPHFRKGVRTWPIPRILMRLVLPQAPKPVLEGGYSWAPSFGDVTWSTVQLTLVRGPKLRGTFSVLGSINIIIS